METECLMGMEFSSGAMKMFWNLTEVIAAQHCECSKHYWIVYFKMVHLMLCEFYLSFLKSLGIHKITNLVVLNFIFFSNNRKLLASD